MGNVSGSDNRTSINPAKKYREKEAGPITSDSGAQSGIAFAGSGKELDNAMSSNLPERKKMSPENSKQEPKYRLWRHFESPAALLNMER